MWPLATAGLYRRTSEILLTAQLTSPAHAGTVCAQGSHGLLRGVTPSLGARTGGVTPFGESLYPLTPVQRFVQGRDVFVSLPTGSGKSLCYWLLPSVVEHLRGISCCTVIVVSPLDAERPRHAELLLFAPLS